MRAAIDLRASGFMAKALMPSDRALSSLTSSLKPVQRIIGRSGRIARAFSARVAPFIFGMVNQCIVYAGWNPDWFKFFLGIMLLFAVIANNAFRNYAAKR